MFSIMKWHRAVCQPDHPSARPISARKDSWTTGCQGRILSHFSSRSELCMLKLNPFITAPHSLSFLFLLPILRLRAVFFPSTHTEIYLLTLQLPGQIEKLFIFSPSWDTFVAQNLLKAGSSPFQNAGIWESLPEGHHAWTRNFCWYGKDTHTRWQWGCVTKQRCCSKCRDGSQKSN